MHFYDFSLFRSGGKTVNRYRKLICLLMGILMLVQATVLPAKARMNPAFRDLLVTYDGTAEQEAPAQSPEVAPVETVPAETFVEEAEATEPVEETQPDTYDEVPLYYQTDYPDTMFSSGTIESSGCSIVSLAMVATYLTDHKYDPAELAGYFGGYVGSHRERLEYASDQLQLPWEQAATAHDAIRALKDGKVVIALMSKNSIFTDAQHFVVLAGMTVDGKVIVNDPYEPNYTNWRLEQGFINGFEEDEVCWGFGGGWIYDKNAMPSEPFIYVEEEKPEIECRYPGLELTDAEMRMFAKILWLECRGESVEGQQAVAEVILNRLVADNFPNTLRGVIYAEGQFPSIPFMDEAKPTQTQYEAIEAALYGPYLIPKEVVFYATYKENDNYWGKIGKHYFCYQYGWTGEDSN